jgi:hypothetical protein
MFFPAFKSFTKSLIIIGTQFITFNLKQINFLLKITKFFKKSPYLTLMDLRQSIG